MRFETYSNIKNYYLNKISELKFCNEYRPTDEQKRILNDLAAARKDLEILEHFYFDLAKKLNISFLQYLKNLKSDKIFLKVG